MVNCDIFLIFCSKQRLWVHVRTASLRRFYEYLQFMFWGKNKKIMYTPVNPNFTKVGCKGVYIARTCYHDEGWVFSTLQFEEC